MRFILRASVRLALLVGVGVGFATAQTPSVGRPQGYVVITEHPTTAENVTITMLDPNYPTDLLRSQAEAIGRATGAGVRGLFVQKREMVAGRPDMVFARASFATNHLISREEGLLRLQPVVRAFAGAPEPYQVQSIAITFDGERPLSHTLQRFRSDAVDVQANFASGTGKEAPFGVEYRVALLTQDPEKIVIPDRFEPTKPKPAPTAEAPGGRTSLDVVLVVVAVLAAGVLVYLLVLRMGPRERG